MRALLAILSLSVAVAGCALPAPPSGLQKYQVLRASIVPTAHDAGYHGYGSGPLQVGFALNRPAYVALFEITPGAGTSLLYPRPGTGRMDGFTYAGMNSLLVGRRHNAETYIPTMGLRSAGPRFLFLIASERPLELGRFGAFGYGLRGAMGTRFASLSAYDSMEQLAELALPSTADDGSWTTDMYVYWPEALDGRGRGNEVLVRCNGYAMAVPFEYVSAVQQMLCDPRTTRANPATPGDSTAIAKPDSAGPTEPKRRAPLPRAEEGGTSLRERITSSTQLEEEARRSAERAGLLSRPERRGQAHGRAAEAGFGELGEARPTRRSRGAEGQEGVTRSEPRAAETPRRAEPAARSTPREERPREVTPREAAPRERPEPSRPSSGGSSSSGSGSQCNPCQQN